MGQTNIPALRSVDLTETICYDTKQTTNRHLRGGRQRRKATAVFRPSQGAETARVQAPSKSPLHIRRAIWDLEGALNENGGEPVWQSQASEYIRLYTART